jgi:CRISPR/Cas system-associated protein Cas10 (large subunit of type III CRISPR-Cas system)
LTAIVGNNKEMMMIHIRVGEELFVFPGRIDVDFQKRYLYEKTNPFVASESFRHGVYYTDILAVSLVASALDYQRLYFLVLKAENYYIGWEIGDAFQYRQVKEKLPYPSRMRFISDLIEFSVESKPYYEIIDNMCRLEILNRAFGMNRIVDTIWN